MKFCEPHWGRLREAIDKRGLSALVAEGGEAAAKNLAAEIAEGPTIDNFDPLMSAHNAIWGNAMSALKAIGANPLMILAANPEHPEWECPICCMNWCSAEHDRTCTVEGCTKPRGLTYDDWIDRAADDALEAWKRMAS